MRIPMPQGWERSTKMDSENIRFAIRSPGLATDGFTPNAVVTLMKAPAGLGEPEQLLQEQNEQLTRKLKLTDLVSTPAEVCGEQGLLTTYTAPEVSLASGGPPVPPRTAKQLGVVYEADGEVWVATVTVQTVKPDDQTYIKESDDILKGFQLLPPR